MGKRTIAAIALGLIASACSSGKEAKREDEVARDTQAVSEPTTPKTGRVTSVNSQRLMLDDAQAPGDDTELFERTTRSLVIRDGREISWDQLQEGDVVRVLWDRGVFGPDRVARVEVLDEDEAQQVRSEMENENRQPGLGDPMGPREISPPAGTGMPGDPGMTPGTGTGTETGPVEPGSDY